MKLVLLGDSDVGKTTLIISFTTETTCTVKLSDIFEVYIGSVVVDSERLNIECWYTSASGTTDARRRHYDDATAILVCFAANNYKSFENAKSKWYHEARSCAPDVPIFLVKTKSDTTCADTSRLCEVISTEMGERMAEELQAITYMECSSFISEESVQKVFETVARHVRALGIPYARTTEQPTGTSTYPAFCVSPTGRTSWMHNISDVALMEEAIKYGAPRELLRSQFTAALYLDTFRAKGCTVISRPARVITAADEDIFHQACLLKCGSAQMATKQRTLLFIDQMRAKGRGVYLQPTWVTDESTTELYTTAVAKGAPPHALNSLKETKLFLLGVDDTPRGTNSWLTGWTS